jgi:hypothetical protein
LQKAWNTDHALENAVGGISGQSKKLVNKCAEALINFEQVCQGGVELKGRKMGLGFNALAGRETRGVSHCGLANYIKKHIILGKNKKHETKLHCSINVLLLQN